MISYKILKTIKSDSEFNELWSSYEKTIKGDRRTKAYKEQIKKEYWDLYHSWQHELNCLYKEEISKKQKYVSSDVAAIKLIPEVGNPILPNNEWDGLHKYAIINESDKVPNEYELLPIVLMGKYKIMAYDCAKSFDDNGEIIESNYIEIYKNNDNDFIFKVN